MYERIAPVDRYIAYLAYLFNPFFVRVKLERSPTPARYHPVHLNVHFIYAPTKIIRSDVVLMRSKGSSISARQGQYLSNGNSRASARIREGVDYRSISLTDELFLSILRRLRIVVTPSLLYEATCGGARKRLFGEIFILHYFKKKNFYFGNCDENETRLFSKSQVSNFPSCPF